MDQQADSLIYYRITTVQLQGGLDAQSRHVCIPSTQHSSFSGPLTPDRNPNPIESMDAQNGNKRTLPSAAAVKRLDWKGN